LIDVEKDSRFGVQGFDFSSLYHFFSEFWSLQQDEHVIFSKEKTRRMRERERVEGGREIERERETHWHQR
jgi:hypothetical protein